MGRLDRLEVENFKSYNGRHTIGPFRSFSAIIGPNGSGKSNVMDAVCFVLGLPARYMRGKQLKDLIHDPAAERDVDAGDEVPARPRRAYVKAVYSLDDDEVSLLGLPVGTQETEFTRVLTADGTSTYRLDNAPVSLEAFNQRLEKLGIVVAARNFLIFQGDVESLASRKSEELLKFFESVSGSDKYISDYDEADRERREAEDKLILASNARKTQQAECKELQREKEEAELYEQRVTELSRRKAALALVRLHHVQERIEAANEAVQEGARDVAEQERAMEGHDERMAALKREEARLVRLKAGEDKKLEEARAKERKATAAVEVCESTKTKIQSRIDAVNDKSESATAAIEEADAAIAKFRASLTEAQTTLQRLTEEYDRGDTAAGGIRLTKEQQTKLDELMNTAHAEANRQHAVLEHCERELETLARSQKASSDNMADLQRAVEENTRTAEDVRTEIENCSDAMKEAEKLITIDERELDAHKQAQADRQRRLAEVDAKLQEVTAQLRGADDNRRESDKERQVREVIADLKRSFPGVHGKLFDLIDPTERRWYVPVASALGRHMDSIVADTAETCKACIQHLHTSRKPPMTFLALDKLKPEVISDSFRAKIAGASYRLARDCVRFEGPIDKAVHQALGTTVICDTLEAANTLRFERNVVVKCVTVDGSVIAKSGLMTGGVTGDVEKNAGRWDTKVTAELEKKRDALASEAETLKRQAGGSKHSARPEEIVDLEVRLQNTRNRFTALKAKLTGLEQKLTELAAEKRKLDKSIKETNTALAAKTRQVTNKQEEIEALKQAIGQIEDGVLAGFSASLGVSSYRQLQEEVAAAKAAREKALLDVNARVAQLSQQLEYEEREKERRVKEAKDSKNRFKELTKDLARCEKELVTAHQEKAEAIEASRRARAEVDKLQAALDAHSAETKEVARANKANTDALSRARKELEQKRVDMNRLLEARHDMLHRLRSEQIEVPLLVDEGAVSSEDEGGAVRRGRSKKGSKVSRTTRTGAVGGEDVDMDEPDNTQQSQEDVATMRSVAKDERLFAKLDFAFIDEYMGRPESQVVADIEEEISQLNDYLARSEPNMKAVDKYKDASARLQEKEAEYKQLRDDKTAATEKFTNIKSRRIKKFMKMYTHVQESLDGVYKELTRSDRYPLGGSASIVLANRDDPFTGEGIRYNAMPPTKRFNDMDKLSGGEKTVAALALLFAINNYRPAPFYIMDEIDAALDNENVHKVCTYIAAKSSDKKSPLQCLVISLKDSFYGHAETIVGICKDRPNATSRTYTLDLSRYAPIPQPTLPSTLSRFSSATSLGSSRLSAIQPAAGTPGRMTSFASFRTTPSATPNTRVTFASRVPPSSAGSAKSRDELAYEDEAGDDEVPVAAKANARGKAASAAKGKTKSAAPSKAKPAALKHTPAGKRGGKKRGKESSSESEAESSAEESEEEHVPSDHEEEEASEQEEIVTKRPSKRRGKQ